MLLPFSDEGNFWIWIDIEALRGLGVVPAGCALVAGVNRRGTPWGDAATMALAWVAFFINAGLGVIALPLWTVAALVSGRKRDRWFAGQLAVAFVLGCAPSLWFGRAYHAGYNYARVGFDFTNFSRCAASVGAVTSGWLLAGYIIVTICGLCAIQYRRRAVTGAENMPEPVRVKIFAQIDPLVWRSALVLAVTAFYLVLFANMGWVKINDFAFRYFMFPLMLVPAVCAAVVVEAGAGLSRCYGRRIFGMICACGSVVFMAAAVFQNLAPFGRVKSFVEAAL